MVNFHDSPSLNILTPVSTVLIRQCLEPAKKIIHIQVIMTQMGFKPMIQGPQIHTSSPHCQSPTYFNSFMAMANGSVSPSSSTMTGAHILENDRLWWRDDDNDDQNNNTNGDDDDYNDKMVMMLLTMMIITK